jgi:hypothetical protein
MTFSDMLELDPCLSKLGFEKCDYTAFFLYEGSMFWGLFTVKKMYPTTIILDFRARRSIDP